MAEFSHYPAIPPRTIDPDLLTILPREKCPYLPGRAARHRGFIADRVSPLGYHGLMDAGFRRSGALFYQPICAGCRQCVPLRAPVDEFEPSKSQRRVMRRNDDLEVRVSPAIATDEARRLYARYQREWHGNLSDSNPDAFLYDSPVDTIQFAYRDPSERLVAVGICDVSPLSLSSVYFFFDPSLRERSLGTFGALTEILFAQRQGIPYYYLGFWVKDCRAMGYKARFGPHELLGGDGVWRSILTSR